MNKLLDELLNIINSGDAPAQGFLMPKYDIVHDYYNRLVNVIKDAEQNQIDEEIKKENGEINDNQN